MGHRRVCVVLALVGLLAAVSVSAQTPTLNPTLVEFDPSPDHGTLVGTVPVLTKYTFDAVVMNPAGAIAITKDLGKPTPNAAGKIVVVITELATITKNVLYTATITAVGPNGAAPSGASNPFAVLGAPRAAGSPVVR